MISRHGLSRKRRLLFYSNRFRGNMFLFEGVTSNGCAYLIIKNTFPSSGCCFDVVNQ
jgi:hypothetical protein